MPKRKRLASATTKEGGAVATVSNDGESSSVDCSDAAANAIQPINNDVLFGRGDSINRHPGNKKFRELVDSHKRVYLASRFKQEKRMIADSIMSAVGNLDPPGRFLAKDATTGLWQVVEDARAREKTLQALREKARTVRTQAEAREAPRPALPSTTTPFPTLTPFPPPHASVAARNPFAPPNATSAFGGGLPSTQTTNLALAAMSRQPPPQSGVLAAAAAAAAFTTNPADLSSLQASVATSSNRVATMATLGQGSAAAAASGSSLRPLSQPVPLGPPPALPSTIRPRRGSSITIQQGLSSRLMPAAEPRVGLQEPQQQDRPTSETSTSDLTSDQVSLTPQAQIQNHPVTTSPVSAGTFDALQRVAFPESPSLDYFFGSANHPFSPRRLPPTPGRDSTGGLQGASASLLLRHLNPLSSLSPRQQFAAGHASLPPRQPPTPTSTEAAAAAAAAAAALHLQQTTTTSVSARAAAAAAAGRSSIAAMPPPIFPVQQLADSSVFSPIPTNGTIVAGQEESNTPTPNRLLSALPANFFASPSRLPLLGHASPTSSRAANPRGIPLPRANLAPRVRREDRVKEGTTTNLLLHQSG